MYKYKMTSADYFLVVTAISLFLFGFLITAALIMVIFSDSKDLLTKLILMLFLGFIPILSSWFIYNKLKIKKKVIENTELEQSVLRAAKNRGGIISPSELALDDGIPLETAKQILDKMQIKGFAMVDVADDGEIVYKVHI